MKLKIKNFAKISSAEISINGITVIAGNNDTGKSTVGKILCGIFNSMSDIDRTLEDARFRKINAELRDYVFQTVSSEAYRTVRSRSVLDLIARFSKSAVSNANTDFDATVLDFTASVNSMAISNNSGDSEINQNDVKNIVQNVLKISDESLIKNIVSMYFQDLFNEQINDVENSEKEAEVQLDIKGQKRIKLEFKDDVVKSIKNDIVFTNFATYIDNPFVLDGLNGGLAFHTASNVEHSLAYDLLRKLRFKGDPPRYDDDALSQAIVTSKLGGVFEKMIDVVPGNVVYDNHYKYRYGKKSKSLDVSSLSTGVKSFVLIKQLLANSSIKEKDVLVLDEPEIHLHPEWQLKYAEIIVLLQKKFNLNIVITTHSSHFLEALDIFAKIHDNKEACNYYLVKMGPNNRSNFIEATDDISRIFSNLVSPSLALDHIKAVAGLNDE